MVNTHSTGVLLMVGLEVNGLPMGGVTGSG